MRTFRCEPPAQRRAPMPLARFDAPFEHPDWIFEPKLDGFRAIAYVEDGACRLVSRNRQAFRTFEMLALHRTAMTRISVPSFVILEEWELLCQIAAWKLLGRDRSDLVAQTNQVHARSGIGEATENGRGLFFQVNGFSIG